MTIISKKVENLKPDKEYIITVRAKNNDINIMSEYTDSVRFVTPTDTTTPSPLTNLKLYAGLENVMFVFDYSQDADISKYEYELYQNSDMSDENGPLTGLADANIFTVRVDNLQLEEDGSGLAPYYGRARAIDTAGNVGAWTTLTQTDEHTPLIDNQYIGSLTASKITAGTIGAHTITLNSASSIIKSSNFDGTPVGDGSYASATTGWLINGQGKAYFYDATIVGSIDIGGFDSGSFHVNTYGDMWLGAGTYGSAPFRVYRTGQLEISAGTGSTIGGQPIDTIAEAVIDFNARNNRNATTPTAPTINSDGTAIDHTINTDGSVDISFEWNYTYSDSSGVANNIDGFIIYLYSSTSSSAYTFGTTTALESTYPLNYDQRAIIFSGVAADKYYTFGVRAYRVVDSDVDSNQILYSSIIKSSATGENPYQPSSSVNYTGNIAGTLASTVVSYANAGNTVATNFNANNDRNSTTPTAPTIASDGTAIDHVINTDGSADISFEWSYTVSDTYNAANNIDGFIVYVRSSASAGSYTFGTTPVDETTYYLPREKRAFILPAGAANRYYNFGVRAYRMVDTDISAAGIIYSSIIQSTGVGENPYQPSSSVAFAGDITGTINSVAVTTVTTAVSNFNSNNDRKSTTPATPTSVAFSTATSNTNASIDLPLTWAFTGTGDAYDIDGFVIFLRTTTTTNANNITTADLNTNIQQVYLTAEKRSHTFSGISPSSFYRAAIRAYRVVDTDINSAGIIYGSLANTTERSSATAVLGGSSGISIGSGKIYIGAGNYNNSDTGFYVDSTGQFSLKDKLTWNGTALSVTGAINATSGTFSGTITASGTISGGTITGATITGSTLTTAASGNRVNINSNDITIYYTADNLASISISGSNVYTNEIKASGTLKIRGLDGTANNYMQVGHYPGGLYQGVRLQGFDGVTVTGVNDSDTGFLGHLVVRGSSGNEANLTLYCTNSHIQLRAADNNATLYLRRANDTAYADLELNVLRNQGAGIVFAGSTVGGGSANQMGMSWANPNILGTVDNVVSAVLGTVSDRRVKANIETFTSGLSELQNFRVVKYNPYVVTEFTEDGPTVSGVLEQTMVGLIADEVEQVAPWLVQGTASKRELQSVNYALITPLLINAIKEINERLEVLENK